MVIEVCMVIFSLRFTVIKCGVRFSFKCLSFTNVHCNMHSLVFVPSLAILGGGVRESQTSEGPGRSSEAGRPYKARDIMSKTPHVSQWSGCGHCCHLSGWSCCSPVETSSRSVWCSLKRRGTLVMWGIASESFGSTYTKNDYLG